MARVRRRRRTSQRGFTLVEIILAAAIIAVLAAIAIPAFTEESRKGKAITEVTSFFAELSLREEQYKVDNGAYLPAVQCPGAPAPGGQDVTACASAGQPWNNLRVLLPQTTAACTYEVVTGTGTGTNNPVIEGQTFTFTSPATAWYYIVGRCNMDSDGTKAVYFSSSVDSTIQKKLEGD